MDRIMMHLGYDEAGKWHGLHEVTRAAEVEHMPDGNAIVGAVWALIFEAGFALTLWGAWKIIEAVCR